MQVKVLGSSGRADEFAASPASRSISGGAIMILQVDGLYKGNVLFLGHALAWTASRGLRVVGPPVPMPVSHDRVVDWKKQHAASVGHSSERPLSSRILDMITGHD